MKEFSISNLAKYRSVAVIIFIISLVINGLSNTTILGGNNTAEVSDRYPTLFTPDGVTFAIWGIIYMLVAAYCVRLYTDFGQKRQKSADQLAHEIIPNFIIVSLLNAAWLISWQYRIFWLSVILMVGLLWTLAKINLQIKDTSEFSFIDWLTIKLPFSIYFGWITIATIANISVWLVSINWNGWGVAPQTWTVIILIVGILIGVITAWRLKSWPFIAVFVWAYYGIWLKHTSSVGYNNGYPQIVRTLVIILVVLSLLTIWLLYKYPKSVERE